MDMAGGLQPGVPKSWHDWMALIFTFAFIIHVSSHFLRKASTPPAQQPDWITARKLARFIQVFGGQLEKGDPFERTMPVCEK